MLLRADSLLGFGNQLFRTIKAIPDRRLSLFELNERVVPALFHYCFAPMESGPNS
jgi:hypothetical protein